jgi:hypothetical protein
VIRRLGLTAAVGLGLLAPDVEVGPSDAGWRPALSGLEDTLAVAAVVVVLFLLGATVTRKTGLPNVPALVGITMTLLIGGGLIGSGLMVLGLAGWFTSQMLIAAVLAAVMVSTTPKTIEHGKAQLESVVDEFEQLWNDPRSRFPLLGSAVVVGYLMLTALGPTTSWDGPMYHVDLPREFLAEGRIFLPSDNPHVAFVGSPQIINAVLLAAGAGAGPALMQWIWLSTVVLSVVSMVMRWMGPMGAGVALSFVWSFPMLPLLGTSDLADMSMAAGVLACTLAALAWVSKRVQPSALFLGCLVGATLITKYQAGVYLIGIGALVLTLAVARRIPLDLGSLALSAGVAVVIWAPLIVKNFALLEAPLYPFFGDRYVPAWVFELDPEFDAGSFAPSALLGAARDPFSFWQWITSPGSLTPESSGTWYGLPAMFLLGLGALFTRLRTQVVIIGLPIVVGVTILLMVSSRSNLRYLVPVAPLAVIMLAVFLGQIANALGTVKQGILIAAAMAAGGVAAYGWMADVTVPSGRASAAIGVISQDEWDARQANDSERRARELGSRLAAVSGPRADPALLLYEGRGDLINAPVLQDNVFQNWALLQAATRGDCPTKTSWSLLVRSVSTFQYLSDRGGMSQHREAESFEEFAERCLDLISNKDGYQIYRVVDSG